MMNWRLIWPFLLLQLLNILFARAEDSHENVTIGFVFILTAQREFGSLQQVSIWESYFRNVPKSLYATIVVNWPFGERLPSFVSVDYGHETDYGGTRYVETYLAASKVLIEKFNVTGTILLSGSCLPVRPFHYFYDRVTPHLSLGHSILYYDVATVSDHMNRYEQIKSPRVSKNEWHFHFAQGYILHNNVLNLLLYSWKKFGSELQEIESIDEHYVAYILLSLSQDENDLGIIARNLHKNLVRISLMHTEWHKGRPRIWTETFTREEVLRIRRSHDSACFVRKVSHNCKVDSSIFQ